MKRALLVTLFCFAAVLPGSMQAPTAADGPWAGWAQCVVTAQFVGQGQTYLHQQTHTWALTGSTPLATSTSAIKQYAATWQVTGHGTRQRGQSGNSEQWTTAGQPMPDTLTIRLTAEGTVRVGGAAQLRSTGTTTGAPIAYVEEWQFPVIEGPATTTTLSGSTATGPVSVSLAPGAPPGTLSTGTCSWNFVRGGAAPAPPSPISALPQVTPGGAASRLADTLPGGLTADTNPRSSIDPRSCTLRGPGNLGNYALPTGAVLRWPVLAGTTGYTVIRSDVGDLTPTPLSATATGFREAATLKSGVRYTYFVVAHYPTGCGSSEFRLSPTFGSFDSFGTNAKAGVTVGTVVLNWKVQFYPLNNLVLPNAGVHLEGPGLPPGGLDRAFGTESSGCSCFIGSQQVQGIPAGNRTWTLTIYWVTSEGRVTASGASPTLLVP